jgi:hypothetical protein
MSNPVKTDSETLARYDRLHGRTYVHEGVSGVLKHGDWPFGPAKGVLMHCPDAAGQQTEAYHALCEAAGALVGTLVTDLTHAEALGECSIEAIERDLIGGATA